MKKRIAWHDQARRMLASGAYPSKAAIARELSKSVGQVYEVLSADGGAGVAKKRIDRQRRQYRTDPAYRAQRIAEARAYADSNPVAPHTPGSGKYPLQIRCDAEFLSMLDRWIAKKPEPMTRSEAVRTIVRSVAAPPALTRLTSPDVRLALRLRNPRRIPISALGSAGHARGPRC